ncbi:MAG TPA: response regulator transcription factor [Solirubrobacterales bacterium]|nr:response regulator transcription factor [Solirubrobacterales bacterium]
MSVPLKARILLADDHEMVRDGLALVIDSAPDLEVTAVASDGVEAIRTVLAGEVDLAVLDVSMPGMTGINVAREISRQRPDVRVLMLSMHDNERYFLAALEAGASGYVLKSAANRELIEACRQALRGGTFIQPRTARAIVRDLATAVGGPADPLTPRESDVVKLIAEGHTSDEIGEMLIISSRTVDRHRANVLEKLGLRNRVDLTRYAIRRGLVEA